ncbi:uncharacterized protein JCM6883_000338 [Sporobolomyces salmoneus]|uniref:uncharacterized protein n=1 Tax=Sporobolomyces salmoneus TaxID=183962 RepID=UPI003170A4A0
MNSSTDAIGERSGPGSPAASSPLPTPLAQPPRSPYLGSNSQPLSSSPSASGTGLSGPSSPSLSSSNRFGLSLGNLVRRPRGWTTSSAQRSPGTTSPGSNAGDQPPSPTGGSGAGERGNGYGFPALRRSLSKRTSSNGANVGGSAGEGASSSLRTRHRRSSSQPPQATTITSQGNESGGDHQMSDSRPATPSGSAAARPSATATSGESAAPENQRLRLVPHLESSRSLHFEPIERDLAPYAIVKVGRFTDRSNHHQSQAGSTPTDPARVAFKSKVVSRGHAEIWTDESGKFFIKDTKSSSGTFLNHIRLSAPNSESRPFPLKDGDVLQLGVDYQGGTEEIYRCVKMRVELNRAWQRGANSFNTAALAQLRALGGGSLMEPTPTSGTAMTATPSHPSSSALPKSAPAPPTAAQQAAAAASITDCCICLYPVTVCQALFIAPCSHVTHFKCIRPLVEQNYPGFCCPLCRTYADLEADVEIDPPELPVVEEPLIAAASPEPSTEPSSEVVQPPSMAPVEEAEEPASRAGSIRSGRPGNSRRSSAIAIAGPDGLPPGITVTPHRGGRSRPSSRAPSIAEQPSSPIDVEDGRDEEDLPEEEEGDHDEEEEEEEDDQAADGESQRASPSSSSQPLPMPFSSSHLSATTPSDLYASLANATTPPNNTFLSTLADSSSLHLTGMLGGGGGAVPGSSLRTPMSLDAALEAVERPTGVSAEATRSGSGSGGEETDRDLVDDADGETEQGGPGSSRENVVMPGGTEVIVVDKGKGKGKESLPLESNDDRVEDGVKKPLSVDQPEENGGLST